MKTRVGARRRDNPRVGGVATRAWWWRGDPFAFGGVATRVGCVATRVGGVTTPLQRGVAPVDASAGPGPVRTPLRSASRRLKTSWCLQGEHAMGLAAYWIIQSLHVKT